MIKHGYCATCGAFTAEASYVDGLDERDERLDFVTDDELAQVVRDALQGQGSLDLSGVSITVLNQVVTLSGNVSGKDQKRLAGDIAYEVPAVLDVHNVLAIGATRAKK